MTSPDLSGLAVEIGATPVLPVSIPAGASGVVIGRDTLLLGWALRNTSATIAAQLDLYDGLDPTGQPIAPITLVGNESTRDYPPAPGILCRRGLYVDAVAGSVAGVVWVAAT